MRHASHLTALLASVVIAVPAHSQAPARFTVRIENPLDLARTNETISLTWTEVHRRLPTAGAGTVRVLDAEGREVPSQVIDEDGDGTMDALLFQADLAGRERRRFTVEGAAPADRYAPRVAVRHDEPRDDLAWENDRVAFRAYGKGLRKLEALSSSGFDVWEKRTSSLILGKWYSLTGRESYHVDTGEGADFFHVGETLGAGGTAGWRNDTLWRADNFAGWKILATGPIRAVLELRYDPWNVAGRQIAETKRIVIDAGQNVYRLESVFSAADHAEIPYVIGIVKRRGMVGTVSKAHAWGWLTGWGPVTPTGGGHGELGTAVLLSRAAILDWKEAHGHYLAVSRAMPGQRVVHYVGAGWTASGQFARPQDWWRYLSEMAQRLESPVQVSVE